MFWSEESPWPLAHYTVPLSLYALTHSYFASLWLVWAWESIEYVLFIAFRVSSAFGERWDDILVGDPLQGVMGISAFALADSAFGWGTALVTIVPLYARFIAFFIICASASLILDGGAAVNSAGSISAIGGNVYQKEYTRDKVHVGSIRIGVAYVCVNKKIKKNAK